MRALKCRGGDFARDHPVSRCAMLSQKNYVILMQKIASKSPKPPKCFHVQSHGDRNLLALRYKMRRILSFGHSQEAAFIYHLVHGMMNDNDFAYESIAEMQANLRSSVLHSCCCSQRVSRSGREHIAKPSKCTATRYVVHSAANYQRGSSSKGKSTSESR